MALELRLELDFSPRRTRAVLTAGLLLWGAPLEIGSQNVAVTASHPAPSGVYNRLITTGGGQFPHTILNRNGGNVFVANGGTWGIGMNAPDTTYKLHVSSDVYATGYLRASSVVNMGPTGMGVTDGYLSNGTTFFARFPTAATGRVAVQNAAGALTYAAFGPTQGPGGVPGGRIIGIGVGNPGNFAVTAANGMRVCTYYPFNVSVNNTCTVAAPGSFPFDVKRIANGGWQSIVFRGLAAGSGLPAGPQTAAGGDLVFCCRFGPQ